MATRDHPLCVKSPRQLLINLVKMVPCLPNNSWSTVPETDSMYAGPSRRGQNLLLLHTALPPAPSACDSWAYLVVISKESFLLPRLELIYSHRMSLCVDIQSSNVCEPSGCAKVCTWLPFLITIHASSNLHGWSQDGVEEWLFSPSQAETWLGLSHSVHGNYVIMCYPHTRLLGISTPCLYHESPWSVCAFVSSFLLEWVSTSLSSHKPLVQVEYASCVSHVYYTSFLL